MLTTPYPYLQEYLDFLHYNPCAGFYYLSAFETADYTCLIYDTNDNYLMQAQNNPFIYLYGQKAERWWQLLSQQGLLPAIAAPTVTATSEVTDVTSLNEPVEPGSTSAATPRSATLEPEAEKTLFKYLNQLLTSEIPAQERCCQHLSELRQLAETFTQALNDRIQRGVKESLAYYESADRTGPGALLHERCTSRLTEYDFYSKRATGRFREYTFIDKVVVPQVQAAHVRPFQLAGVWVDLPQDEKDAMPVQLGFTDNRQQVVASRNGEQSQRLTKEWCLEQGYRQLLLDPSLRLVVETYGTVDPERPTRRWLSSLQLTLDLVDCLHSELFPEELFTKYPNVNDDV
ncbi:hypothetical protein FNT36_16770 [Hymenobacter setariae]|uniref:Uncharacterized protein n=1 Tax=Hymenobacter setariae TaxID=2594794 RepID=A0A558BS27_9BACT|nr:hypothetical protein [Hymenobacter setariae]TVT39308.1 hypothetical protein FNT36_16770 [Hymenobacter setariae]